MSEQIQIAELPAGATDNFEQQLASMLSSRERGNVVAPVNAREGHESASWNSHTNEVQVSGHVRPGAIDLNRDYTSDLRTMEDTHDRLVASWESVLGWNADKSPKLAISGRDRDTLARQIEGLRDSIAFQREIVRQADAHKATLREAQARADREAEARHAFAGNDPVRKAALDKALLDEEARTAARSIVASRK